MNESDADYIRRVGLQVRLHRIARRLTQDELAELSGVSRGAVGSIERGDHPSGLHCYRALASAFGIELGALVNEPLGATWGGTGARPQSAEPEQSEGLPS